MARVRKAVNARRNSCHHGKRWMNLSSGVHNVEKRPIAAVALLLLLLLTPLQGGLVSDQ